MNSKRRDRVVIFRVSGDEYQVLLNACARGDARSMSDFARQELFSHLDRSHKPHTDSQRAATELLDQLRTSVSALIDEIEALRKKWTAEQPV